MNGVKRISLGLQGGGAYGAFGWGVLDRLLADERLDIDGIGAASGGAINAVALADGYALGGGREGARRKLGEFWHALGSSGMLSPMRPTPFDLFTGHGSIESSPGYLLLQLASAGFAPGVTNPLNINPLSPLLASLIDFERVRACEELKLYISATNVRTGKGHNFRRHELTVQHILASACIPQMFAPVHIDGEAYWDGSFAGNPPLAPLVDEVAARDLLVVLNNPIARRDLPLTMVDVHNRANEIAFNTSLIREFSAIQHMAAVVDEEDGERVHMGAVRLHTISATEALRDMSMSSKFNTDWRFIQELHGLGHAAADRWLQDEFEGVGIASTFDPAQVYAPETLGQGL